jgi:hypothetical protein
MLIKRSVPFGSNGEKLGDLEEYRLNETRDNY